MVVRKENRHWAWAWAWRCRNSRRIPPFHETCRALSYILAVFLLSVTVSFPATPVFLHEKDLGKSMYVAACRGQTRVSKLSHPASPLLILFLSFLKQVLRQLEEMHGLLAGRLEASSSLAQQRISLGAHLDFLCGLKGSYGARLAFSLTHGVFVRSPVFTSTNQFFSLVLCVAVTADGYI